MPRPKRPKFLLLNAGTFPFQLIFTIGSSPVEVERHLKHRFNYQIDQDERDNLTSGKTNAGKTVRLKNNAVVIWLRLFKLSTLAHEVFHAANFILDSAGVELCDQSDEVYAHLIGYLTLQIARGYDME